MTQECQTGKERETKSAEEAVLFQLAFHNRLQLVIVAEYRYSTWFIEHEQRPWLYFRWSRTFVDNDKHWVDMVVH